ncbi:hypothetical protein QWI17_02265 [Gilvimarinus sp. SDUM040013]|uniref:Solute-binding protein family 3/N-terminal domain-containing protein n=1 Tax=Gilvimarinus gilvus TaxID=3058038 RepID=A0ABU4RZB5_9GAMM|nr:hypothetical protein [Gilvimarinus sp. SDUM040013]MDO3384656.1 hypothetical protein [Gilvimarinus sp. SDUM040013]MDX6850242.1 hypothetical protein [Gilvimarinus sp. SDUM040013]
MARTITRTIPLHTYLLLLLLVGSTYALAEKSTYRYWLGNGVPGSQAYYLAVAAEALALTEPEYGPWQVAQYDRKISVLRARRAMDRGEFDFHATTVLPSEFTESGRLIVPHPLQFGLLGYRNLLIRKEDEARFAKITSPSQLGKLKAGLGQGWPDVQVLRENQLAVVESATFQQLFPMLVAKRFDYIPLGVEEIDATLTSVQPKYPDIVQSHAVMLVYPLPVYFLVCGCRPELAERLALGLERIHSSGRLHALFAQFKGPAIEKISEPWSFVMRATNSQQTHFDIDKESVEVNFVP